MREITVTSIETDVMQIVEDIQINPIFRLVDAYALCSMLNDGRIYCNEYESGDIIYDCDIAFRKVSPGIMLKGRANVFSTDRDREVCLSVLDKGSLFGIAGIFNDSDDFISTIICKKACTVAFITLEAFVGLLDSNREFLLGYIRFLNNRISFLNRKIRQFTAGSAERKLAFFLDASSVENEIRLPYSISRIAEMLDVGRASLYRAIDALSENGIIEKDGKVITIKDREKLRAYCSSK